MPQLNFSELVIRPGILIQKRDLKSVGNIVASPGSLFIDHFTGNTHLSQNSFETTSKGEQSDFLQKGDVLIVTVGKIGSFYLIKQDFPVPVVANQSLAVIKKNKQIALLNIFSDKVFIEAFSTELKKNTVGNIVPRLKAKILNSLVITW